MDGQKLHSFSSSWFFLSSLKPVSECLVDDKPADVCLTLSMDHVSKSAQDCTHACVCRENFVFLRTFVYAHEDVGTYLCVYMFMCVWVHVRVCLFACLCAYV